MSRISKQVVATFIIVYALLLFLKNSGYITGEFFIASLYAGALNLINVTAAILLFNYAVKKTNKEFLIFNFGGMTVRLLALLVCVFVFFRITDVDKYGFIVLFFVFYFVFLIFEINHFLLKTTGKKRNIDYVKQR
jgi:hypothetical protein